MQVIGNATALDVNETRMKEELFGDGSGMKLSKSSISLQKHTYHIH